MPRQSRKPLSAARTRQTEFRRHPKIRLNTFIGVSSGGITIERIPGLTARLADCQARVYLELPGCLDAFDV